MTLRLAISSWTLHRTLGQVWYEPDGNGGFVNKNKSQPNAMPLLDLPAFVAKQGIHLLEICHFHFPSTDDAYLNELKSALADAGVELVYILIDTGNLSSLDDEVWQASIDTNKFWQDVAAKLGAQGVRVDCGLEDPTPETIQRSADALQEIASHGDLLGLKTVTENWRTTSIQPENLLTILDKVEQPLGLCVDFGNAAKTGKKHDTLVELLPRGTSIHCKAEYYMDGKIKDDDLFHCLHLAKEAGFDGHITLIYDGDGAERANIHHLMSRIDSYIRTDWLP